MHLLVYVWPDFSTYPCQKVEAHKQPRVSQIILLRTYSQITRVQVNCWNTVLFFFSMPTVSSDKLLRFHWSRNRNCNNSQYPIYKKIHKGCVFLLAQALKVTFNSNNVVSDVMITSFITKAEKELEPSTILDLHCLYKVHSTLLKTS